MRFNTLGTRKQNSQKNRNVFFFKKCRLIYGDAAITSKKQFRFELNYIVVLKKYLKTLKKFNVNRNINKKKI